MKCKTILVITLLLGFSDLMAQNQIGAIPKPDAIGIYCVGYGLYEEEKEKLLLTEDEKKMNGMMMFLLGDLRQICLMVAQNLLPAEGRKEINDPLTVGYPSELVSDVFPICKQWEWTKTRCVDTYKSLYDKKAKLLGERYDEANAASKELDKKLGY